MLQYQKHPSLSENLPVELFEDPDRNGMNLDKKPSFLGPSAMSLARTPENMSTAVKRVIGRAIAIPPGMFLPQHRIAALYNKEAQS